MQSIPRGVEILPVVHVFRFWGVREPEEAFRATLLGNGSGAHVGPRVFDTGRTRMARPSVGILHIIRYQLWPGGPAT